VFEPPEETKASGWATSLRYSWLVLLAVLLYVGGTFFLRWRENRAIDQEMARKAAAKTAEEDRRIVEAMGGNRFEILTFYATAVTIRPGESAQLCYGVSNAASVRIDPPVESLRPAFQHCLDVSPRKNTTYTLTAVDAQGNTKTATAVIRVR
jgi:uncharacterized membrane protein